VYFSPNNARENLENIADLQFVIPTRSESFPESFFPDTFVKKDSRQVYDPWVTTHRAGMTLLLKQFDQMNTVDAQVNCPAIERLAV
jgi:hypothetical protein